jgi:hypothetical protein
MVCFTATRTGITAAILKKNFFFCKTEDMLSGTALAQHVQSTGLNSQHIKIFFSCVGHC